MIRDITEASNNYNFDEDNSYLQYETLEFFEPYININLHKASPAEKIQWYYNLFYITKNIDLGLGHCIQHNQSGRNFAYLCHDDELKEKIFGTPFSSTIGADAGAKTSDTMILSETTLSGSKNWFTNLKTADYVTMHVFDRYGINTKVIVDLHKVQHTINSDFPLLLGMRAATPSNLTLHNIDIPSSWIIDRQIYPYPELLFNAEMMHHMSFLTNLTAITLSLFQEIQAYTKSINRERDMDVIKLELDVFVMIDNWIKRLEYFISNRNVYSESWWMQQRALYLFGKKTLLLAIEVSRMFGMMEHMLVYTTESRVFRNAISFSSHMLKLYKFNNYWGGKDDNNEYKMDLYIKHHINNYTSKTKIPETL